MFSTIPFLTVPSAPLLLLLLLLLLLYHAQPHPIVAYYNCFYNKLDGMNTDDFFKFFLKGELTFHQQDSK